MGEKFKSWIPLLVSSLSLALAGVSAAYQFNESKRYSSNTHQVLINSAELAKYDLKLLDYKVSTGNTDMRYGELNVQLDSLKQNLETIKDVDPTTLPKTDSINYQVYRQDLNTVVKLSEDAANSLRKDRTQTVNNDDNLDLDISTRPQFDTTVARLKQVLNQDEQGLKQHKNLYHVNYSKVEFND